MKRYIAITITLIIFYGLPALSRNSVIKNIDSGLLTEFCNKNHAATSQINDCGPRGEQPFFAEIKKTSEKISEIKNSKTCDAREVFASLIFDEKNGNLRKRFQEFLKEKDSEWGSPSFNVTREFFPHIFEYGLRNGKASLLERERFNGFIKELFGGEERLSRTDLEKSPNLLEALDYARLYGIMSNLDKTQDGHYLIERSSPLYKEMIERLPSAFANDESKIEEAILYIKIPSKRTDEIINDLKPIINLSKLSKQLKSGGGFYTYYDPNKLSPGRKRYDKRHENDTLETPIDFTSEDWDDLRATEHEKNTNFFSDFKFDTNLPPANLTMEHEKNTNFFSDFKFDTNLPPANLTMKKKEDPWNSSQPPQRANIEIKHSPPIPEVTIEKHERYIDKIKENPNQAAKNFVKATYNYPDKKLPERYMDKFENLFNTEAKLSNTDSSKIDLELKNDLGEVYKPHNSMKNLPVIKSTNPLDSFTREGLDNLFAGMTTLDRKSNNLDISTKIQKTYGGMIKSLEYPSNRRKFGKEISHAYDKSWEGISKGTNDARQIAAKAITEYARYYPEKVAGDLLTKLDNINFSGNRSQDEVIGLTAQLIRSGFLSGSRRVEILKKLRSLSKKAGKSIESFTTKIKINNALFEIAKDPNNSTGEKRRILGYLLSEIRGMLKPEISFADHLTYLESLVNMLDDLLVLKTKNGRKFALSLSTKSLRSLAVTLLSLHGRIDRASARELPTGFIEDLTISMLTLVGKQKNSLSKTLLSKIEQIAREKKKSDTLKYLLSMQRIF